MTDKELRRLSRSELLEMLIAQTEENSQLKIRLEQAEAGCHQPRYQGAVGKRGRPDPAGGRGIQPKSTRGCGCLLEAGRCQSVQTAGRPGSTAAIDSVRWRG